MFAITKSYIISEILVLKNPYGCCVVSPANKGEKDLLACVEARKQPSSQQYGPSCHAITLPLLALVFAAPEAKVSVVPNLWSCSCCSLWIIVSRGLDPSTACSLTTWFRPDTNRNGESHAQIQCLYIMISCIKDHQCFIIIGCISIQWRSTTTSYTLHTTILYYMKEENNAQSCQYSCILL